MHTMQDLYEPEYNPEPLDEEPADEPDLSVVYHGSIVLLSANTPAGQAWLDGNIADDVPTWGDAIAVEPRYIGPILDGAAADGLDV